MIINTKDLFLQINKRDSFCFFALNDTTKISFFLFNHDKTKHIAYKFNLKTLIQIITELENNGFLIYKEDVELRFESMTGFCFTKRDSIILIKNFNKNENFHFNNLSFCIKKEDKLNEFLISHKIKEF